MRILYICDRLPTFILNEVIELKNHGHEMFILVNNSGKFYKDIHEPIVKKNKLDKHLHGFFIFKNRKQKYGTFFIQLVYDFFAHPTCATRVCWYLLKNYTNLKCGVIDYLDIRSLFDSGIDLIHSPFSTPRMIDKVYLLSKVLKVPFTLCFRAHDLYQNKNMHAHSKNIEVIKKAARIITIALYNREYIYNNLTIEKNIEIIRSSLDPCVFQAKEGDRSHKSIVAVGRLEDQKGLKYLIKACDVLHTRGIDYECTIIGEGPERDIYQTLIAERGIPNIHLVGCLTNEIIMEYLDQATMFVLPCDIAPDGRRDILANVLKEAMAMKVPVITSKMCGIEELIDDGVNGMLVSPQNPEAIANAIEALMNRPDQRKTMGVEGRKKIEQCYNIKMEVQKLERIFTKAVAQAATSNHS